MNKKNLNNEIENTEDGFEPFEVGFKVISNSNPEMYIQGYVSINDEYAEYTDWYYWTGSGYQSRRHILHDGISITGATFEQENEMSAFDCILTDEDEDITDIILQSEEDDENIIIERENLTIIINEGD